MKNKLLNTVAMSITPVFFSNFTGKPILEVCPAPSALNFILPLATNLCTMSAQTKTSRIVFVIMWVNIEVLFK